jgi:hypothetical protein
LDREQLAILTQAFLKLYFLLKSGSLNTGDGFRKG